MQYKEKVKQTKLSKKKTIVGLYFDHCNGFMRLCSIIVRVAEKHRECELRFRAGVSCQCRFLCYVSRARVADQGGLDWAWDWTKVAWTGLGTSGQWTLPKPCSGKKKQLTTPGPVPERVQLILDLGPLGFWQNVQNLQKVRLLIGWSQ